MFVPLDEWGDWRKDMCWPPCAGERPQPGRFAPAEFSQCRVREVRWEGGGVAGEKCGRCQVVGIPGCLEGVRWVASMRQSRI